MKNGFFHAFSPARAPSIRVIRGFLTLTATARGLTTNTTTTVDLSRAFKIGTGVANAKVLNNPSTGGTPIIIADIPETGVKVAIYTVSGVLVTTLADADISVGRATWNLQNGNNAGVQPGIYIVRLTDTSTGYTKLVKVVLLQ